MTASAHQPLRDLEALEFDNSYSRFPEHFFHRVNPTPLEAPFLISVNTEVAQQLGIAPNSLDPEQLAQYFGGHKDLPGTSPLAMKYTGHQFGVYNPQLGDGRGLLLGELIAPDNKRWDLHLKGSGKTNYSRFGDGRAVLRSSIREYLISAAMQGLGIPTTQALCIIGSQESAIRDGMPEPCATVLRVTECHIRFGHFEHFYYNQRYDDLRQLSDYCLKRYFPEYQDSDNPPLAMLQEVIRRSAYLVAQWQAYGFVHGVMNTDNMSLIGETFDYGPYQFMDAYKPHTISNHSDHQGRYAFQRQPDVMLWNLFCLAQCFVPLVADDNLEAKKLLEDALDHYHTLYNRYYYGKISQRLGLHPTVNPSFKSNQTPQLTTSSEAEISREDQNLIDDLMTLLESQQTDMTLFFRLLSEQSIAQQQQALQQITPRPQAFEHWLNRYHQHLELESLNSQEEEKRQQRMKQVNPVYLLRNYMAQEAISAAEKNDFTLLNQLLPILSQPFIYHKQLAQYAGPAPDWAAGICLTCSS